MVMVVLTRGVPDKSDPAKATRTEQSSQ
jgi:hypothetical protein